MVLKTVGTDNELLPDTERHLIRDVLSDAEKELVSIDAEIEDTRSDLRGKLLALRASKFAEISRMRIAVAPHQTLPPELLAKIFVHCLESEDDAEPEDNESSAAFLDIPDSGGSIPWTLGHVCSRWRRVALQEPRLWNHISILCELRGHINLIVLMLQEAISRAGQAPLTIHMFVNNYNWWEWIFVNPLLLFVAPHIHRISGLHLKVPMSWMLDFLPLVTEPLRALKSLSAELEADGNMSTALRDTSIFEGASSLQTISFTVSHYKLSTPITWFPGDCRVPWAQLTCLELGYISIPPIAAHDLLSKCHALETCTLTVRRSLDDTSAPTARSARLSSLDTLVLPRLQVLEFEIDTCDAAAEFLQPLVVPSLYMFGENCIAGSGLQYSSILSLIKRSHCNLTMLDMSGSPYDHEDIALTQSISDSRTAGCAAYPSTSFMIMYI